MRKPNTRANAAKRSKNRQYASRSKSSSCRGKGPAVCRSKPECKYVSGKKRNFCRKKSNKRLTKKQSGGGYKFLKALFA